jgi:hypothetical protein
VWEDHVLRGESDGGIVDPPKENAMEVVKGKIENAIEHDVGFGS